MSLVYVCCAWLVGIYFGQEWNLSHPYLWLPVPLFLVAIWLLRNRRPERFALILGLMVFLGILRAGWAAPRMESSSLVSYHNQAVKLTGVVVNYPDVRDSQTRLILAVDELSAGSEDLAIHDNVLINSSLYPRFRHGDYLQVEGYLRTPPVFEDFSYRDHLARQNIFSLMAYPKITLLDRGRGSFFASILYSVRQSAQSVIGQILPDPEAALLSGILLGVYQAVPTSLMNSFNATGTSHIIVISGFNITILAAMQLRVFNQWLTRRLAVGISITGIAFYTLLVGADAAVVRAAIMGSTILFAVLVGRESNAPVSLAFAALLMTVWNPLALWDISFQLSTGATLGLILFASSLYQRAQNLLPSTFEQSVLPLIKDTLVATLAAQVFTLPLILYYFRRVSLPNYCAIRS